VPKIRKLLLLMSQSYFPPDGNHQGGIRHKSFDAILRETILTVRLIRKTNILCATALYLITNLTAHIVTGVY